jgi:hypothetical protein
LQVTTWPDKVDTVILHATHNGKDSTRERQDALRESHPGDVHLTAKNPFKPAEQPKYDFKLIGPETGAVGWRIHFDPKVRGAPGLLMGDAWVDPEAGTTLRMDVTPSKLPDHADRVNMRMEYGAMTPAGLALSKMVVDGEGHFLFFHQRMKAILAVSDYQRGNR